MASTPEPDGSIVVGVDGSPASAKALAWAANQARLTGSHLRPVTTWSYPKSFGVPVGVAEGYRPDQDAETVQKDALAAAGSALDGIEVDGRIIEGDAALSILEQAKNASLIVIGSRGHREIAGLLLGSVSEYLVTHSQVPVVVVHAG